MAAVADKELVNYMFAAGNILRKNESVFNYDWSSHCQKRSVRKCMALSALNG